MQPTYLPLRKIFGGSERFVVPLFQRPYVWSRKEQWEPLWSDIRVVAERVLDGHSTGAIRGHFLGSVVIEQRPNAVGSLPQREIIDGQQRLTTMQIVLRGSSHAMLAAAQALPEDTTGQPRKSALLAARQIEALTVNANVEDDEELYKVWPTNDDRTAFRTVMDADESGPPVAEAHRLAEAYRFFRAEAAAFLQGDDGSRTKALAAALQDHLRLIILELEDTDEPQAIFETLNARGTPLLPTDLVKNWLLWEARRSGEDAALLYETHWSAFDREALYWRTKIGTGHNSRPRADTFLANWLVSRTGQSVPVNQVYEHFLRHVAPNGTAVHSASTWMKDIRDASLVYRQIERPSSTPNRFAVFLSRLAVLDVVTLYPLLMHLMARRGSDDADRDAIATMLESYLVRRLVCDKGTRGYSAQFVDWVGHVLRLDDGAPASPEIHRILTRTLGQTAGWPLDDEFRHAWLSRSFAGMRRERTFMILRALEERLRAVAPKTEPATVDFTRLQIEHVMPQSWQQHWPLPAPAAVLTTQDPLDAAFTRHTTVHSIGNLTLVTGGLNGAMSNAPWLHEEPKKSKRAALTEHSDLRLNRQLTKSETWDEATINTRARRLFEVASAIWPGPAAAPSV